MVRPNEVLPTTKGQIPKKFFAIEGAILEFTTEADLTSWLQTYTESNPGKGLAITEATKRVIVVLGNEVSLKTSVEKQIKQVESSVIKIEVGEIK